MLRFIRSNAIALLALSVALGTGGAWAADKVGSKQIEAKAVKAKHIANNAVRTKHIASNAIGTQQIKDGQVGAQDLGTVTSFRDLSMVTLPTNSQDPLTPKLEIAAQSGNLVSIHGRIDINRVNDTGVCEVLIEMDGPVESLDRIAWYEGDPTQRHYLRGTDDTGAWSALDAVPKGFPVLEAGTYTFQMIGMTHSDECEFSDRNLLISVIG